MNVREQTVNAIRVLSAEAIQKANSGHPGLPLGSAPIGYTIFADFLKFNPKDTKWDDRDRFVLSAGHGSMLLYSLLYLFGYDISKEDLMNFRQLGYKTPGHPEYGHTPGVETTTGPLGQGIGNAVGMALAEAHLAATFNREGFPVVDHYTYALCGDGCLEEGISYEACSFAGMQKLGKLILFYDDNDITIEGSTDITFKEDVSMRFKAQGWQVLKVASAFHCNSEGRWSRYDFRYRLGELFTAVQIRCGNAPSVFDFTKARQSSLLHFIQHMLILFRMCLPQECGNSTDEMRKGERDVFAIACGHLCRVYQPRTA